MSTGYRESEGVRHHKFPFSSGEQRWRIIPGVHRELASKIYDLSLEVEGLKSTALARKDTPSPARMKTTHRLRDEPTGLFSREASPARKNAHYR
jgi:hypothetical protein